MRLEQLLALLGRPLTDSVVERALTQLRIRRRPQVEIDLGNVDGSVVETQDWVINRHVGIEFGFEDEASFLGRGAEEYGTGPMLLTQIYFYGYHDVVQMYRDVLPFGLQVDDDRKTVRAKLATWEATRRSYVRDTWELPEFRVTVSYADDAKRVGFILFLQRRPTMRAADDIIALLPTIDEILGVLGKPLNDPGLQRVFEPLRLELYLEDRGEERIADLRESYGFELRFRRGGGTSGGSVFSHVLFYRDGEMDARGWPGSLPLGLKFDDSPEKLLQVIALPPDNLIDETFVGYALWHLPDYSMQVRYSTMENWILCVHVMAPGVWDA